MTARRDLADFVPLRAPVERGRLVYDFQVADAYLGGLPGIVGKLRWVREHLPAGSGLRSAASLLGTSATLRTGWRRWPTSNAGGASVTDALSPHGH